MSTETTQENNIKHLTDRQLLGISSMATSLLLSGESSAIPEGYEMDASYKKQLRHVVSEVGLCLREPQRKQDRLLNSMRTIPGLDNIGAIDEILEGVINAVLVVSDGVDAAEVNNVINGEELKLEIAQLNSRLNAAAENQAASEREHMSTLKFLDEARIALEAENSILLEELSEVCATLGVDVTEKVKTAMTRARSAVKNYTEKRGSDKTEAPVKPEVEGKVSRKSEGFFKDVFNAIAN